MKIMTREQIVSLMQSHRGNCVNCGTEKNAPSIDRVKKAEERIEIVFPNSYKWFLSQFGGVEIGGNEIFSLYSRDFDTISGGDMVHQYEIHLKDGFLSKGQISIALTDFGETFIFQTSVEVEDNEYPVYVKLGEKELLYASNFLEFVAKFIDLNCGEIND